MSPSYPEPAPPTSTTPPPTPTSQTAILHALSSLLQLHHHQRWLPSTAAHNLASLRRLDTPPPPAHDTMHHLQHTTQTQQKETWEAMTPAQRRAVYERLLRLLRDAARAARAAERSADGQLLDAFDREFDGAVAALVEGWRAVCGGAGG